jgi:hypothetical protein
MLSLRKIWQPWQENHYNAVVNYNSKVHCFVNVTERKNEGAGRRKKTQTFIFETRTFGKKRKHLFSKREHSEKCVFALFNYSPASVGLNIFSFGSVWPFVKRQLFFFFFL